MYQIDENNTTTSQSGAESTSAPRRSDPKRRDRKKAKTENSEQTTTEKKETTPQSQTQPQPQAEKKVTTSKETSKTKENEAKKEDKKKEEKKKDEKKDSQKEKTDKKDSNKKEKNEEKKDKTDKKEKSDKKEKTEKAEKSEKPKESTEEKEVEETIVDSKELVGDSIFPIDSTAMDSVITIADSSSVKTDTTTVAAYLSGNEPMARTNHPGHDSGIMMLLTLTFIMVAFSFKYYRRMLSTYGQDLWNVRSRANAFNEHTANDRSVMGILIFQLCVYSGLLISAKISSVTPINPNKIMLTSCCLMGAYGLFYLFQLAIYSMVGYVFSDKSGATQWIKGFNASQIFLGFSLIIPTMISIFYPTTTGVMLGIASTLYVVARLTFIYKGFRIFYINFYSLFYFILYLCTLEIIPIIFVYKIAQFIFGNLQ